MAVKEVEFALHILPYLLESSHEHAWIDYDPEVDVLYVSFERPRPAEDAEMTEDDVILRYAGERLVGVTVLNARKRLHRE